MADKAQIFASLQQEILNLQGYRAAPVQAMGASGLRPLLRAFPQGAFPISALHEFTGLRPEDQAASTGFITALIATHIQRAAILWIGPDRTAFPPGLAQYGAAPENIFFLQAGSEKAACWAVEEALRCHSLGAVVAHLPEPGFTASRRFQLAIERSGVTLFLYRHRPRSLATSAIARWRVRPLPGALEPGLPGVGHPRWEVVLEKVRNGQGGRWEVEWSGGNLQVCTEAVLKMPERKTG